MTFQLPEPDGTTKREWADLEFEECLDRIAELRKQTGDAYVALDVWILKPSCYGCRWPDAHKPWLEPVPVWPPTSDGIIVIYDISVNEATFLFDKLQENYWLPCHLCGARLSISNHATIQVVLERFSEYFGLSEEGPKKLPTELKRRLKQAYGHRCVDCDKEFDEHDLTVDHIVARAHGGGNGLMNLQVMCLRCNKDKGSAPVRSLERYLDLLLLPIPE